jgi:hypothetical protein
MPLARNKTKLLFYLVNPKGNFGAQTVDRIVLIGRPDHRTSRGLEVFLWPTYGLWAVYSQKHDHHDLLDLTLNFDALLAVEKHRIHSATGWIVLSLILNCGTGRQRERSASARRGSGKKCYYPMGLIWKREEIKEMIFELESERERDWNTGLEQKRHPGDSWDVHIWENPLQPRWIFVIPLLRHEALFDSWSVGHESCLSLLDHLSSRTLLRKIHIS